MLACCMYEALHHIGLWAQVGVPVYCMYEAYWSVATDRYACILYVRSIWCVPQVGMLAYCMYEAYGVCHRSVCLHIVCTKHMVCVTGRYACILYVQSILVCGYRLVCLHIVGLCTKLCIAVIDVVK